MAEDGSISPRSEPYHGDDEVNTIASIMERIEETAFPVVLPVEQNSFSVEVATDLLTWVQKMDSVLI
jgi:hypothetical protein